MTWTLRQAEYQFKQAKKHSLFAIVERGIITFPHVNFHLRVNKYIITTIILLLHCFMISWEMLISFAVGNKNLLVDLTQF